MQIGTNIFWLGHLVPTALTWSTRWFWTSEVENTVEGSKFSHSFQCGMEIHWCCKIHLSLRNLGDKVRYLVALTCRSTIQYPRCYIGAYLFACGSTNFEGRSFIQRWSALRICMLFVGLCGFGGWQDQYSSFVVSSTVLSWFAKAMRSHRLLAWRPGPHKQRISLRQKKWYGFNGFTEFWSKSTCWGHLHPTSLFWWYSSRSTICFNRSDLLPYWWGNMFYAQRTKRILQVRKLFPFLGPAANWLAWELLGTSILIFGQIRICSSNFQIWSTVLTSGPNFHCKPPTFGTHSTCSCWLDYLQLPTRPSRLVRPKHCQFRFLLVSAELRAVGVVAVGAGRRVLGASAAVAGWDAFGGAIRNVGCGENEAWSWWAWRETGWETGWKMCFWTFKDQPKLKMISLFERNHPWI